MAIVELYVTLTVPNPPPCEHLVIRVYRKSDNQLVGGPFALTLSELSEISDDHMLDVLYQLRKARCDLLKTNPTATKAQQKAAIEAYNILVQT
jgi:hypothetical protein